MSLLSRRQQMQLSVPTAPSQLSIDEIFSKENKMPTKIAPQVKALQVPTKKSEATIRSSRRKITASKFGSSKAGTNSGALCMTAAAMAPVALRCFLNGQGGSHYSLHSDYIRQHHMAQGKASNVKAADGTKQLMQSAMQSPRKGKIQQWSSVAAGAAMALAVCRASQTGQRNVNKELSAMLKTATSTVPVSDAPKMEKLERAFQMRSSDRFDSEAVLTQDSGKQTPVALEFTVPTESDLLELFTELQGQKGMMAGCIGLEQVREAIIRLNEKYGFGLVESHAPMLALFMKKTGGQYDGTICPVQEEEFVAGLARLFASFGVLRNQNLSVQELRKIIIHAYEHFDTNGDKEISFEEFKVATAAIGLDLEHIDEGHLLTIHEFFCPTQEEHTVMSEVENSSWKNFQELLTSKIEGVMENNKIKQLAHIGENIMQAIQKPGTIPEKMERGIAQAWEGADQLLELAEGAVDAASMAVASAYLQHEVQATLEVGQVEDLDFTTLAPFVLFLGANLASVAKEFSELIPRDMAIDEALVFARIFNKRNFSQDEYMKLVHCPGCRLRVAQPGEVIWDSQDESLKLIAKGHASLIRNSQKVGTLLPSSTMGEAEFLQKGSYLHNSVAVADETVLYVEWEQDQLHKLLDLESSLRVKMMCLLVDGLARNIDQTAKVPEEISIDSPLHGPCNKVWETIGDDDEEVSFESFELFMAQSGLQDDLDLTADQTRMLFSHIDTDCDGVVTTAELKEVLPHFQALHFSFGNKAQAFAVSLLNGTIDQDSLQNICDTLGLVVGDQSMLRIQNHLGIQEAQKMDLVTVLKKLNGLYGIHKSLQSTSFAELMTVISRAFDDFDTNGDGMMDLQEFQKMSEVLQLDLTTEQVQTLHAFFDTDGDGVVVAQEWKDGCVSPGGLASYVRETIVEQADRKGWSHLEFLISSLYQIMTSPADFSKKWKLAQAAVQDKAEQLADLANGALDMVSIPAAMAGMWRELAGMETLDDVSGLDVAPFLLFLAISSVSFLRRAGEGQITDMRGPEAFVFSKMFEKEDIPVTQFQKLMKSGEAKWSTVKKGEPIPQASDKLHLIVLGCCSATTHCGRHSLLTSGKFVGESQFLDDNDEQKGPVHTETDEPVAVAIEDTTIVTWDIPSLKKDFKFGESIPAQLKCQMKFRHLVTMSLAQKLLEQAEVTC